MSLHTLALASMAVAMDVLMLATALSAVGLAVAVCIGWLRLTIQWIKEGRT